MAKNYTNLTNDCDPCKQDIDKEKCMCAWTGRCKISWAVTAR